MKSVLGFNILLENRSNAFAQQTGVSESSVRAAAVCGLQLYDPADRVHFLIGLSTLLMVLRLAHNLV
jgi:hypothetical protein